MSVEQGGGAVELQGNPTTLPPEDRCAVSRCGRPEADHRLSWSEGGAGHSFEVPEGRPNPKHIVACHIQTDWTCSHCGQDNDVWGTAYGWMECGDCGGYSYLEPFLNY